MERLIKLIRDHFEAGFYLYLWFNASVLAVLVGRPRLPLVGLVSVLPFFLAYAIRARRDLRVRSGQAPSASSGETVRGEPVEP